MSCTLCDLPTPDPPLTDPEVPGEYCCRGCLEVARTVDDPTAVDDETAAASVDRGPDDAEGETAFLSVSGMHCATCEAFIESRATERTGVRSAAASYPTETVKVTYDSDEIDRETIAQEISGLGYRADARDVDAETDESVSTGRLLVGAFFGMMTMLWYILFLYPHYLGISPELLLFDLSGEAGAYLVANVWLMATVVLGYTGYPLFRGAYVSLRAGHPNMDLLVALAAAAAYAYSTVVTLLGGTEVYFDVAVVVVLAVAVGNYYESRVKRKAAGRLADLTAERVSEARRRTDSGTEVVDVESLSPGDEVVATTGDRLPVDGPVVEGRATVDESLVTGESTPVTKEPGDEAVGGAVVTDGRLVVGIREDVESTFDRVVRTLWDVQSTRPGAQRLADRIAVVFVPLVFVLAAIATGWQLFAGARPGTALLVGLSVLVVSCPCALGLATPLAVARGIRGALDAGVVITDASAFESAPDADTVIFDKTGTLTTGEMRILDRVGDDRASARAAAVERYADHPVAAAIVDDVDAALPSVTDFDRVPGRGVAGRLVTRGDGATQRGAGVEIAVGNLELFESRDWTVPEAYAQRAREASAAGNVPVLVGWDGGVEGVLVAGDRPRPEWERVVDDLSEERRVVVLTGDDWAAAERFRDHDGVEEVFAGVPPEGKTAVVEQFAGEGTVAMVGDGVNDAPALAAADIGIALDHTALAAGAADAVVTTEDLSAVPRVFDLTAATNGRIKQNLGWAFVYNAIALPLAVAGALNPLLAAVAMATSSLLVVLNSSRSLL
ncbi:heavy metal translocating P-type ATPase [Halobellus ordinarius]|uniref:heavy metal translocating P-type ATPase n=1 Tax=Halobellus ordinarius TaxID=3075120 RepID=UPI0028809CD0|nr:cation-translocating P-type ATPase [Halobellus sp. ZY16]